MAETFADRADEQKQVEALVEKLEEVVTRLTNLDKRGGLSTGWCYKDNRPYKLVEAEILRLAAMEMIVLLTGDYDDEKYESWLAVLMARREGLGLRPSDRLEIRHGK